MAEQELLFAPPEGVISACSRQLRHIPHLSAFLGAPLAKTGQREPDAVACWADSRVAARAKKRAARLRVPFLNIYDGFFRSLDPRNEHSPSCSLVIDRSGIYYDASRPSDLENLLNAEGWESRELLDEARKCLNMVIRLHLSKYNLAPDASPYLLTTPGMRTRILLLDQDQEDSQVSLGMADSSTFERMVEGARRDHPGAALFLRVPTQVLEGQKKGFLYEQAKKLRLTVINHDVSPHSLLAQADEVYTVSSQIGFDALLMSRTVHCYGMPFYAGWGLTRDKLTCARRTKKRTMIELFAAACLLYSRYANPVTGLPCTMHDALRLLAEQRLRNEQNAPYTACLNFRRRQYALVRGYLGSTRGKQEFFQNEAEAVETAAAGKGRVAIPASRQNPELARACRKAGVPLLRVQDAFFPPVPDTEKRPLFITPSSQALDSKGLFEDSEQASALENLLEHTAFSPELLTRAAELRKAIIAARLLLGSTVRKPEQTEALPELPAKRTICLVLGQPEHETGKPQGDSLPGQAHQILRLTRKVRPEAYIIYLPNHGGRNFKTGDDLSQADLVLQQADLLDLLPKVAEVHTMSSLAGLDALLRKIPVFTYGGPFYAGWGLTVDQRTFSRRSRPLSLDALIAGCLILYPAYYDWHTQMFCGPEDILHLLGMQARHKLPMKLKLERFVQAIVAIFKGLK